MHNLHSGVGFGLCLVAIIWGPIVLFPGLSLQFGLPASLAAILGITFLVVSRFRKYRVSLASITFFFTALYFFSDLVIRPHGFSQIQFPILLWLVFSLLYFTVLYRSQTGASAVVALLTICCGVAGFVYQSNGELLFSDDHPCFLYRLIQLKENFPRIPFYNPFWNGGVEAREFFPSGILNVFFLFAPLIYFSDLTVAYNNLVLVLLFIVPMATFWAAGRLLQFSLTEIFIAITLALTNSLFWYRWALGYGTLGFILSAVFIPLSTALIAHLVTRSSSVAKPVVMLAPFVLTLTLLWSPACLLFVFLLPLVLSNLRSLLQQPRIVFVAALLLLLNVPWMVTFVKVSSVANFVSNEENNTIHHQTKFKKSDPKLLKLSPSKRLMKRVRENLQPLSPLVLIFGIPGLLMLPRGKQRQAFMLLVAGAGLLGTIGPAIKPQLELERMFVVLGIALTLPAARLISELMLQYPRDLRSASVFGLLALLPLWLLQLTTNRTSEQYYFASPLVGELAQVIRNNSVQGRTLFAGFTLHELSNGHVAPLAAMSQVPLIASSYQHDRWQYIDIIPNEFLQRGQGGIIEYLNLMNVENIVTHDRKWTKWFRGHPEMFEQVWQRERFNFFKRKQYHSSYFLEGSGEIIEQSSSGVRLRIDGDKAVIKFNYLPFLVVSGCRIYPATVSGLSFIGLADCHRGEIIDLKARTMLDRLL